MKCADTEHNYLKFDDATVVCTRCADQRVVDLAALIAHLPQPTYLPCPWPHHLPCPGPHYPTYVPWWSPNTSPVIYGTSVSTSSGVTVGDTISTNGGNVTLTANAGSLVS